MAHQALVSLSKVCVLHEMHCYTLHHPTTKPSSITSSPRAKPTKNITRWPGLNTGSPRPKTGTTKNPRTSAQSPPMKPPSSRALPQPTAQQRAFLRSHWTAASPVSEFDKRLTSGRLGEFLPSFFCGFGGSMFGCRWWKGSWRGFGAFSLAEGIGIFFFFGGFACDSLHALIWDLLPFPNRDWGDAEGCFSARFSPSYDLTR